MCIRKKIVSMCYRRLQISLMMAVYLYLSLILAYLIFIIHVR
jgi:hypothetical protein